MSKRVAQLPFFNVTNFNMEVITTEANNINYSQIKKTNSNVSSTAYEADGVDQLTKFIYYASNDNRV